jgi:hypothetical protein
MKTEETAHCQIIRGSFFRERKKAVRFATEPLTPSAEPVRRPAKVAKMLALAHHLNTAIEHGVVTDRADAARTLGLSRARITQLLDLTLIAPDVQARIVELEAVDGVEPLAERQLRAIVAAGLWPEQRAAWAKIEPTRANASPCTDGIEDWKR